MIITLDDKLAAHVQAVAASRGEDPNNYAVAAITNALMRDKAVAESADPDADLNEEEKRAIDAGIDRGLADFDAGRFNSAEDFYKKMREKHGIFR
jgi:predicted transcriptional regulator